MRVRACLFRTVAWCGFCAWYGGGARDASLNCFSYAATSGYFTLIFSFLRDISSTEQHDAVVQDIISLLSSTQDSAALRLNMYASPCTPSSGSHPPFIPVQLGRSVQHTGTQRCPL